jgi:predicted AAA+ superfamily ATPase
MIDREIIQNIKSEFFQKKAIVLLGARQVGKSTLLKTILKEEAKVLWLDAENPDVPVIFENATATRLASFFEDNQLIVIYEAQTINNIGSKLKLITDYLPEIQVIATG